MDLIIRKNNYILTDEFPFTLELRDHGPVETSYSIIAFLTRVNAINVLNAGSARCLYPEDLNPTGSDPF